MNEAQLKAALQREAHFQAMQNMHLRNHFDANDTMFLERQLVQLRQRIYEVQFAPTMARTFAPKATDIAPSAEIYSYKVVEPVGKAKFITYKSKDIPRVDVAAREVLGKVHPIGAAYGWTINELREAARLGIQLSDTKSKAAADFIERGIDSVLAVGSIADETATLPDVGLNGLVNNPYVVNVGIVSGLYILNGSNVVNPAVADPEVITTSLAMFTATIANASDNTWQADTLLLPQYHYSYLQNTPFSTLTGETLLTVFRRNNPQLTLIAPWYKLNTAGAGGLPRAVAYKRDSMVLEAVIPQEFESMPPIVDGFEFLYNCHARVGGVKVYQPLAMRYMDFLTS